MNKYRPAVMAIILNDNNEFLIGESPRDGGFKFPQGGKEENQNSFENIKRELNEEIGIDILEKDIIKVCNKKIKYKFGKAGLERFKGVYIGQEIEIFLIKYNKNMFIKAQKNEDDGFYEFSEFYWIKFSDFEKYNFKHRKNSYLEALKLCDLD